MHQKKHKNTLIAATLTTTTLKTVGEMGYLASRLKNNATNHLFACVAGILIVITSSLIGACSSGTAAAIINNNSDYGNLQGYTANRTYSIENLQSFALNDGICNGIYDSEHALACLVNKVATTKDSALFGAGFNPNTFVTSSSAALGITGVSSYQLTYNSPGQANIFSSKSIPNLTLSGLLLMPTGINEHEIKGVVLYYHPTVFSKTEVPSGNTAASLATQQLLAAIFASQGYIVVAPDYPGQGVNINTMHPYAIYPKPNALSGIYLLKAARTFLANTNLVNANTPFNLYISSMSEGGSYALWASRLLQNADYSNLLSNNNLTLKRTVGISGAYDLSNTMLNYGYNNSYNTNDSRNIYHVSPGLAESSVFYAPFAESAPGLQNFWANYYMVTSKASLVSYMLAAFINYNATSAAYNVAMLPQFVSMKSCFNLSAYIEGIANPIAPCPIQGSFADLFNNPSLLSDDIATEIISSAVGSTYTLPKRAFFTSNQSYNTLYSELLSTGGPTNNSIIDFVNDIRKDPTVLPVLQEANTYQFTTTSPLTLVYLAYDSTVPNINSQEACSENGVKGTSAVGMVDCVMVDNTNLYSNIMPGATPLPYPTILPHANSEFILNLVALNAIKHSN